MTKKIKAPIKPDTRLVTSGRDPQANHGFVNPPVYHASTLLYPTAEDQVAHRARYNYGRRGTPTSEALEDALRELDGETSAGVALLPSGLAAIAAALLAVARSGDHVLVPDSVYRPTRNFCNGVFRRLGVETTYYDPVIGADIAKSFRTNTRAVFVEAPGSQSFEMQDIPAIAKVAHDRNAIVMMDNTWATPLYFRAFEKGVDMQIQAGTKYIGGHSDIMFGCVSANAATLPALKDTVYSMGLCVGPDDMYLALRGLRTLGVRLARHYQSGLRVARWLEQRPVPGAAPRARNRSGPTSGSGLPAPAACWASCLPVSDSREAFNESLFGLGILGGSESPNILFDCLNIASLLNGRQRTTPTSTED
jgi:cystathionine beta-lyase